MATHDKQGREYAKLSELKVGDIITIDTDFDCMHAWSQHKVLNGECGLYITCTRAGKRHYLDGQADDGEHLTGMYHGVVSR